ncbi:Arginine metabolism regulation II [Fusarium subglutinans]|uniref:Arginine metabolism regulation II n=1 Tax=Gibberella subglutinans TaxID=42677 RepID=A0A8H5KUY7_GIBSU|nr:Arginine metabolism regulation II [Fusarium subglutinans]KAF5579273.1 Arginine metabolism regulation II [Fusarium subglutinans]
MTDESKRRRAKKVKTRSVSSWLFKLQETRSRDLSNLMQPISDLGIVETQNDNDSEVQALGPFTQRPSSSLSDTREHLEAFLEVQPPLTLNTEQPSTLYDDLQADEEFPLALDAFDDDSLCLTPYTPTLQTSLILDHYFTTVCHFNSSFDSANNPFRSEVARMMADSPLLFGCVLSMSAAHLYQGDKRSSHIPLEFQTEAMSHLSQTLSELPMRTECEIDDNQPTALVSSEKILNVSDELLLSIIFLGMTAVMDNIKKIDRHRQKKKNDKNTNICGLIHGILGSYELSALRSAIRRLVTPHNVL